MRPVFGKPEDEEKKEDRQDLKARPGKEIKRLGHFKSTVIVCNFCGGQSGPDMDMGDRFRTFLYPHWETCHDKINKKFSELFTWREM